MAEYRRYILTLTVVDPSARDKFCALSRPDTFREIRPGREPGQRGTYSVEITEEEYEAALRDSADPGSNLIAVELNQPCLQNASAVPGEAAAIYTAMQDVESLGLTGQGVDVGVTERGYGAMLDSVFGSRIKAAKGFPAGWDPRGPGTVDNPNHGPAMAGLAVPPDAQIVAGAYDGQQDTYLQMLYWMVDEVGVDIISNSQQSPPTVALQDAIAHIVSSGVPMFSSAGNGGLDNTGAGEDLIVAPASYPGVYAVSNFRPSADAKAETSNYGGGIWAAAPGCEVSTYDPSGNVISSDDEGTSGAAAMAAGIAARLMSGGRSAGNAVSYLESTARKTGAPYYHEGAGVLQLSAADNQLQVDDPPATDLEGEPAAGGTDGVPDTGACADSGGASGSESSPHSRRDRLWVDVSEMDSATVDCLQGGYGGAWTSRAGDSMERLYAPEGTDGCKEFDPLAGSDCIDALKDEGWEQTQARPTTIVCPPDSWWH